MVAVLKPWAKEKLDQQWVSGLPECIQGEGIMAWQNLHPPHTHLCPAIHNLKNLFPASGGWKNTDLSLWRQGSTEGG